MEDGDNPCDSPSEGNTIQKQNCCGNEYLQLKFDEDFTKSSIQDGITDFQLIVVFIVSYINAFSLENSNPTEYTVHSIPKLAHSIYVMNQAYLL